MKRHMGNCAGSRSLAFVVLGELVALDLVGPLEAFTVARAFASLPSGDPYPARILSETGGPVTTRSGLEIATDLYTASDPSVADTLIVIGCGGGRVPSMSEGFVDWLRGRAAEARRVCSICTGAFGLAAAGLADGRRITTHWRWFDRLARSFPAVRVERGPIFVRDGNLWTTAGVTAGIDLALALIEDDFGRTVAMEVARTLVVYLKRPGNQEQFSTAFEAQFHAEGPIAELTTWISQNLQQDLSVEALARRVSMSPRTFARKFVRQVGQTPARFVEQLRLEAAKRALEEGKMPLKEVARLAGLGDQQGLRRAMIRNAEITPTEYRERFGMP